MLWPVIVAQYRINDGALCHQVTPTHLDMKRLKFAAISVALLLFFCATSAQDGIEIELCTAIQMTGDDQVRMVLDGIPSGPQKRTVSVWFKPDCSQGDVHDMVSWGLADNGPQLFSMRHGAACGSSMFSGGDLELTGLPPPIDDWNHFVLAYDGSQMAFYLNGEAPALAPGVSACLPAHLPV